MPVKFDALHVKIGPEQIVLIAITQLILPTFDVRQNHDDVDYVVRLAGDIRRRGIKHPVRVRAVGEAYEILTGTYRFLAAQAAGLAEVPCIIVSEELTETDVLVEQTLENEHRKNMSDVERGEAYLKLMRQLNLNQEQLAERLGLSPSAISKILKLVTSLDPEVREQVQAGLLPLTAAAAIARLPDADQQKAIAKRYVDGLLCRDGVQLAVTNALPVKKAGRAKVRAKTARGLELLVPPMAPEELVNHLKSLIGATRTLVKHGLPIDSLPDVLKNVEVAE